jgi:hypothetical protein
MRQQLFLAVLAFAVLALALGAWLVQGARRAGRASSQIARGDLTACSSS